MSKFRKLPKLDDNEASGFVVEPVADDELAADVALAAVAVIGVMLVFLGYAVMSRPARNQRA
jgi:hypothetical protein